VPPDEQGTYIDLRGPVDAPHYTINARGNDAVLLTSETYEGESHLLRAVETLQRLLGVRIEIRDSLYRD
jgi:hypothetical protein